MDKTKVNELRGLACLLVLAFHAIGSEPTLRSDLFGYFATSLQFVRMPIFIAISGLLYGMSRGSQPLTWAGWCKRMMRLLPPYLLVTVVICTFNAVQGGRFDVLPALIFGVWHLWYLLALGVILAAVVVIELAVHLTSNKLWLAAALAALAAAMGLFDGVQEFAVARAVALLPFFLAGAAIGSAPKQQVAPPMATLIYAAGFTALIVHQLSLNGIGAHWERGSVVASALGMAGFLLVGVLCPESRRLRQIGIHSLPIFLWHLPIFAIASGLILHRLHPEPHVAVLIRIALGVIGSICLADFVELYVPDLALWIGGRSEKRRLIDERRELERRSSDRAAGAAPRHVSDRG